MAIRGNKGKTHRYTVPEKLAVLKLLDEGLSQTDVEAAKGISTRTIRRWVKQRDVLYAKNEAINEDKTDINKDISKGPATPDMNPDKTDKNITENNSKTDISDSGDKTDITTEAETIAYEDGLTDGRNQAVEEISTTVEQAYKEHYKDFIDKGPMVEELKRIKERLAEAKVEAEPPETPQTVTEDLGSPGANIEPEKPLWENPWVIAAGIAALGLAATMLGKSKEDAGNTIVGKALTGIKGAKKDEDW